MIHSELALIDDFPGYERAASFLQELITSHHCRHIVDIGGGANPIIDLDFVSRESIEYCVIDKSRDELLKAPAAYRKILADVTDSTDNFRTAVRGNRFDLAFSHMLLEHLSQPLQAHRNIFESLAPGGIAVHFYSSALNLPLLLNRLLPEFVATTLLRLAQPTRDISGNHPKFRAYYRHCGPSSTSFHSKLRTIGYEIVRHTGYIGHAYYNRFSALARAELLMRPSLLKHRIPMTSACLLVLRRPH